MDHLPAGLRRTFVDIVGASHVLDDRSAHEKYCVSWNGAFGEQTCPILRPSTADEVARIVLACAAFQVPIVPQGGNTGLAGGAQPARSGGVIVSLERMRAVRAIDPVNDTICVEAGVTLVDLQAEAHKVDRMFPLSLASEGSCQIGGNIATNAGGAQCLRYGNFRALTLGLEVVLPNGTVWDGLRALRKDATGYDLKQMFIGSEGTLGIITAAVLRLSPRPRDVSTAFIGLSSAEDALTLLGCARRYLGDSISACEFMRSECLESHLAHTSGAASPFQERYPVVVLLEATGSGKQGTLDGAMEEALAEGLEREVVKDATLANSESQRLRLWSLREGQAEVQKAIGYGIKHDVSVGTSDVPRFLQRADADLAAALPGIRPFAFGHLGDGNVHYNVFAPEGFPADAYKAMKSTINGIVHDIVGDLNGSISAEHGIGQLRVDDLRKYKSPAEMSMMSAIKGVLDPVGFMNPGKIFS